ncbi:PhzF family phenazine biosynthesis protein [Pontixanthobacter sp.]|uniref:PhzF family phenazine biosynthesis protein n=1 Tax=Pontixanthobacter sp. TaxID=2792078 RepID=UPI003C7EBB65
MTDLPYWHVDAFADRPFTGNQAAVMMLESWFDDAVLQAIGAENNFAETACMVPDATGAADYELRWFTPTSEVALCGHATLAAGHVALTRDGAKPGDRVTFRTRKADILAVYKTKNGYELSLPVTIVKKRDDAALMAALGGAGTVFHSVSGAEQTAIILYENEAAIRALAPDIRALGAIDIMAICTAPGGSHDVVSRVFVPAWGVDEDSVTGAAHAALAPFWAERLGRNQFTAHQASQRGGDLICRLEGDGRDGRAWLGGPCVTVVEGVFHLP